MVDLLDVEDEDLSHDDWHRSDPTPHQSPTLTDRKAALIRARPRHARVEWLMVAPGAPELADLL